MHKKCSELPYSTAKPRFCVASFQQQTAMSRCSIKVIDLRNGQFDTVFIYL
jgi:hypothetical protein